MSNFHPDRLASRILGMGDVETLIERTQENFHEEQAAELERKMRESSFDLEDFLGQLQQLKGMGPLSSLLEMVPGMSAIKGRLPTDEMSEGQLKKVEALIRSMTPEERQRPEIIRGGRRRRIARGSGATLQDVNQLLNMHRQMQKTMRQMVSGKGLAGLSRMLR